MLSQWGRTAIDAEVALKRPRGDTTPIDESACILLDFNKVLTRLDFGGDGGIIHYVVKESYSVKTMRTSLAKSVVEWFRTVADRTGAFSVAKVEQVSHARPRAARDLCGLAVELVPGAGGRSVRLAVEAQERVSPLWRSASCSGWRSRAPTECRRFAAG